MGVRPVQGVVAACHIVYLMRVLDYGCASCTGRTPIVKHSQQIHNMTCCHNTLLMQRIESVTVLNVTLARKV